MESVPSSVGWDTSFPGRVEEAWNLFDRVPAEKGEEPFPMVLPQGGATAYALFSSFSALLYKGSNSQPQLPHSFSACSTAFSNSTVLSAEPWEANHSFEGAPIKSHPESANFSTICTNSLLAI